MRIFDKSVRNIIYDLSQYDRAYNRFFSKWDCHEQIDEVEIKRLERFLGLFGAFDHDRYVKIDAEAFKPTLQKVLQMLADADLKDLTILDDFMGHRQLIQEAFDTLNDFQFTQYPYYYSTAYSKILHAINPNFFVMWDRHIRKKYRLEGEYRKGHGYANLFLPKMQEVAQQAVAEVMEKEKSRIRRQ